MSEPDSTIDDLLTYAKTLLNAKIERGPVSIRITEVEAYAGPLDAASHAYTRTPRSEPMYGPPGHAYCYFTMGLHWCLNVVWGPPGVAAGVLIRAGEVVSGQATVRERRGDRIAERDLARGPGRIGSCLAISAADVGTDLSGVADLKIVPRTGSEPAIVSGPRVGISRAADEPWRFWIDGDRTVSAYKRHAKAGPRPD